MPRRGHAHSPPMRGGAGGCARWGARVVSDTEKNAETSGADGSGAFIPLVRAAGGPVEMNSFIGRAGLLAKGMALLMRSSLVTLCGTGGVGKTRLLLRLAHELRAANAYEHGVVVVHLADLKKGDDRLASAIAEQLGIGNNSSTPGLARLIEHCRHRRMLLMLDNCEHLVGQAGDGEIPHLVSTLLKASPGLQIMTTSRSRLGVQGEHLLSVSPLCTGDGEHCEYCERRGAVVVHESLRLLIDRAAAVGVDIAQTDYPLAAQLCRLLDGIPQAIELAAPMLSAMTLREMVEQDLLHLLADGPAEQNHHRTLHAMIDWSYQLLPAPERRAWAAVSVFQGGFDREAAEAMCRGQGIDSAAVLGLLARLIRHSLLVAETREDKTRYRMLETIRQYGRDLLVSAGDDSDVRDAHAEYFEALVARCARDWFGPGETDWMNRLRAEIPNLRAAMEHFFANPDTAGRGLDMAITATQTRFFVFCGALNEARRMLEMGLHHDNHGAPSVRHIAALSMSSWVALIQGNQKHAAPLLAQANAAATELGLQESFGPLLYTLGTQQWLTEPDPEVARRGLTLLSRAEQVFRDHGTPGDVFMAQLFLGMATGFLGDEAAAFAEADRVLDTAHASQAPWCISWAIWNHALAHLLHGDPEKAGRRAQESLKIQLEIGDTWGPTWNLWLIANVAAKLGSYEVASQLFGGASSAQRFTDASVRGLLPFLRVQQQAETIAQTALGDDEYQIQVTLGESLTLDRIYQLALDPLPAQPTTPAARSELARLTSREYEIAGLVAAENSNHEIAKQLYLSPRTVEQHVRNINRKLGSSNRVGITAWYVSEATS